jgi:PAS domain S-box-containing protein
MTPINTSAPHHGSSALVAEELGQPNILLVDDQPARLLTYESILEGVGVNCVRALSGREALERLLRQDFAVILLDVSMPEIDGFETARLIREHPRFERTPIIFVTGIHTSQLDTLRGYEAGAIDYIPVPIVPEILRSKVALLVELYRRRSELEHLNRELEITRARLEAESRSSREESRAHLEESERRYRAIFEHPALLTVVLEAVRDFTGAITDWRYQDANANALELLNRPRQSLLGSLLSETLPDRAEALGSLYAKVLATRAPYRYEAQLGDTNFLISLFPLGENTVVSSGLDITSRIRVEREAQRASDADRAEKEWLSAVLNSMNEEVYFTNKEKRYTYANPAALREFGHTSVENIDVESIVRKLEVLRPDGTPRPLSEAPPLRALEGEVIRGEEQLVRIPRTGELRHRQVSSAPVRGSDGEIIGSVSVVRDITEQRRVDAELRAGAERLREADRRKDEFIAMLAHELRNPLVPIRTGVELLKNAREQPQLLDSIRPMMERQVGHMVRLIDDLLDVSRITSGKIELQRRAVALASVVDSAIEANRAAIDANGLELAVNLSEPHWTIDVDPTRFAQIISNLLQNAAKFTPRGGRISVTVTIEQAAGPRPEVMLKVADSGIGISPEMLPRVFDLFAQAPQHGHSAQSGLGIGLALARRLVEMHGGSIEARSDGVGSGTEFTVRIPAPRGVDVKATDSGSDQQTLENIRVLVIDDNRDSADATAMFVGGKGAVTEVAYDAESGLSTLPDFRPDVVLLDIGMPDLDGYEVCRRIRQLPGGSIGVIAITGWGQQQDKLRATQAGFNAHLTKPADPVELEKVILSLSRTMPQ